MHLSLKNSYAITLDDDPIVSRIIERSLGLRCLAFASSAELLSVANRYRPVISFVDIHLSETDSGLDVISALKHRWAFTPVVVVSSNANPTAIADALASGADDFILKPVRPVELVARTQARITDAMQKQTKRLLRLGDIAVDTLHNTLRSEQSETFLSPRAMAILICLIEARGTVVSRAKLKRFAWGKIAVSENALDRKVFEVRRQLADVSRQTTIDSVYGVGFLLKGKESKGPSDHNA